MLSKCIACHVCVCKRSLALTHAHTLTSFSLSYFIIYLLFSLFAFLECSFITSFHPPFPHPSFHFFLILLSTSSQLFLSRRLRYFLHPFFLLFPLRSSLFLVYLPHSFLNFFPILASSSSSFFPPLSHSFFHLIL